MSTDATRRGGSARWLGVARVLWLAAVVGILAIYAIAVPSWFAQLQSPAASIADPATYNLTAEEIAALESRGFTLDVYAGMVVTAQSVAVVFAVIVAGVIFWRRSDDWLALIVALWMILIPTNGPAPPGAVLVEANQAWFVPVFAYYALFTISQLFVFTLFPSGRFHPRWWGWCVAAWTPVGLMVLHPALTWLPSRAGFGAAIGAHYAIALVGIVQQYRHTATAEQRVQVKWALFGMIVGFNIALASIAVRGLTQQHADPFLHVLANLAGVTAFFLSLVILNVGFGFSILRYRLWDIDVLVNRSLVYGALTGVLVALVAGSLLMISKVFEQMTGGQQSIVAVAVAALAFGLMFEPTRRRVQRFVDRGFYGIAIDYEKTPPAQAAASPLRPATQIGSFANLQLVGRGGMADVYRGEHPTLRCPVAIKVLPALLAESPERRTHFEREARAMAALHHPNIVRVYEQGEADGLLFLVMEFIAGRDLSEVLRQRTALSLAEALPILEQVAAALDYAHGAGVVHRDIKPANVMLEGETSGVPRRVVLMDFGVAKMLEATTHLTQSAVIGTMAYIAPEQIQTPMKVDGRADIYSLGVMVYEMLTGQLPFEGQTPLALLMSHLNQPPPDPCRVRPTLSRITCAALLRAMDKEPDRRFGAAGEFVGALRGAAVGVSSSG